ncbi:hypothetical protein ASG43_08065 [Aureimonas sp. Leaf454]|uniref:alpha/beta hydrolase family protein n=1 Tax=Aureimonas sp. Leaf454 TaxID=1736381 RepID=UPI0006F3495B|nr:alpha/beta hydrolase [Aureimonas sp. Leaf454]KQT48795.1 hypothetical protein ASG43_08065 [Aureimonas sp. Leaf454]
MSIRPSRSVSAAALFGLLLAASAARADGPIAPFKDDLFAYPPLTAFSPDGTFIDVDYQEARDIDQRDEVPERRVRAAYVDLAPLARQRERIVDTSAGPLKTIEVGDPGGSGPIVLFVHGRNGDRRLGMNDRTFGGNFNRLKNLVARAGGFYVTVDAGSFSPADGARIGELVEGLGRRSGRPAVVLACASMGGEFCWGLLGERRVVGAVASVVMLSANNPPSRVEAMRDLAAPRRIPLLLAHGTRDKVFGWAAVQALYDRLLAAKEPVRFVSFETGNHGTPLRMIDWRDSLNWLLSRT